MSSEQKGYGAVPGMLHACENVGRCSLGYMRSNVVGA